MPVRTAPPRSTTIPEPVVPPTIVDPEPEREPRPEPVIPDPDPTHTPVVPDPDPSPQPEPAPSDACSKRTSTHISLTRPAS
jgi:hypothetical protein